MCSPVRCRSCGLITWSGCGQHVKEVMQDIPKSQQCQGHADEPSQPGFFSKLFNKNA